MDGPGMRAGVLAAALALSGAPALAEPCGMTAREIFAARAGSVVEVAAIAINPYLVSGRITPKGGTGFLIENGYIATNFHVVADAANMAVFIDQTPVPVELVGIDPTLDIAVLAPWEPLGDQAPLALAGTGAIEIGMPVFAIGFPFGLGKSISQGILSGTSRVLPRTTSSWLSPFLQTDAAISPGNSGGPLFNDCGEVVGMITAAIFEAGAENLGFAIPVEVLRPALEEIVATGKVARPWHGLYGQMVSPLILHLMGVPEGFWEETTGFLVETVEPGSAADRAGLRGGTWPVLWGATEMLLGGDIITHVDGIRIDSFEAALEAVESIDIGERVTLRYLRGGLPSIASVIVEERPLLSEDLQVYRMGREE